MMMAVSPEELKNAQIGQPIVEYSFTTFGHPLAPLLQTISDGELTGEKTTQMTPDISTGTLLNGLLSA